ncbi:hypothetical protein [Paraflavitalea pollutisoli]|uniref:hypothetical protein n=1 Tax=Paraflavitalea pollutisoli TaxID=3034143 RepID=UPI0023EAC38E|nr:hypothetical protein [Paraflavitalea sp. H1-2-19X]
MARNRSPLVKLQGTIGDMTFVKSNRYGEHVRAKRYSKTPFVMTDALQVSKDRLQDCNRYVQQLFRGMRSEVHHGAMWERLLSIYFAYLKAGNPFGLVCFQGFECNLQHPLSEVLPFGYHFSATRDQNKVQVQVQLDGAPAVKDAMPRTGYQLRVLALSHNPTGTECYKHLALGPVTTYDAPLAPIELTIPLPDADTPVMLLLGIIPHTRGVGATKIMSDSGMKVVWVG